MSPAPTDVDLSHAALASPPEALSPESAALSPPLRRGLTRDMGSSPALDGVGSPGSARTLMTKRSCRSMRMLALMDPFTQRQKEHQARVAKLSAMTFLQQLREREWYLFMFFFVVCVLRLNMYIGTIDAQLTALGQHNGDYTNIFGIVLPLGFFFQFIVGPIIDRMGLRISWFLLWAILVLLCVLNLIPNLKLQVLTFIIFALFRAFLFSNMSTYLAKQFGYASVGRLVGAVILCGGLVALIQQPLLKWGFSAGEKRGDERGWFLPPNMFLLAISVVGVAFPAWVWVYLRGTEVLTKRKTGASTAAVSLKLEDLVTNGDHAAARRLDLSGVVSPAKPAPGRMVLEVDA
jgi:hypothetical protein